MVAACLLTALEAGAAGLCWAQTPAAAANSGKQESTQAKQPSKIESGSDDPPAKPEPEPDYDNSLGLHFLKNLALDQKAIWTGPAQLRLEDTPWIVPLGGLTAGFIATDRDVSLHSFSNDMATLNHYDSLSTYGLGAFAGGTGALYLWGAWTHDDHKRETGLLAGEAAIDSLAVVTALGYATGRDRPLIGDRAGHFGVGGGSFPSDHAAIASAVAGILSHEYPGPLTKFLAFGAAAAISTLRVESRQHFESDVLVGNAIGWFTAEYVYDTHHDPELGGEAWQSLRDFFTTERRFQSKDMGSPSVPMDSWIYPAFDRLEALGPVPEGFLGQRPWTRMECARLLGEANDEFAASNDAPREAEKILEQLNAEFAHESKLLGGGTNLNVAVDQIYSRVTDISGPPLAGLYNYDFGQTIIDDYGRPYQQGGNIIAGGALWATAGPLFAYARPEFQYAPSAPALPSSARNVIEQVQALPAAPPGTPVAAISRTDLLEGYVGMQLSNWQLTFGKQELWWGPDDSPMLFSNNAPPIEMFQINRVRPFVLPGLLKRVGPMRVQFSLGRLTGYNFLFSSLSGFAGTWAHPLSDQPFISANKWSFKPSPNLEWGFGITLLSAGQGVPFTLHKYLQGLFSLSDSCTATTKSATPSPSTCANGDFVYGGPGDPGDHRSEFDFTYRIPKLRNWLTWYGDSFTDDEITPWRNWAKAAVDSGIYMPRLPKLHKLDLRVEGVFTDAPSSEPVLQHGFFYWDPRYRDGYTNAGMLIGSWIGRQGQGALASTTYWFSAKSDIQFRFRHEKVSREFIPQGGTITDGSVSASLWPLPVLNVSGSVQYETWTFPAIAPTQQSNTTATIGLTLWPGSRGGLHADQAQ